MDVIIQQVTSESVSFSKDWFIYPLVGFSNIFWVMLRNVLYLDITSSFTFYYLLIIHLTASDLELIVFGDYPK